MILQYDGVLKVLAHAIVNTILWRTFLNLFMVDLVVINNNLKNGIIIVKQIELRSGKKTYMARGTWRVETNGNNT